VSRRDPGASRSSSSARGKGAGVRARTDGKVDVQCPQCAAAYRVPADKLDNKIECTECHRVFFPKTTAGKRVSAPDNSKIYVGFGVGAVVLIGILVLMNMGGGEAPKPKPVVVAKPTVSRGDNPRIAALIKWAQAIPANSQLVLQTHSDIPALAKELEVATPTVDAVIQALQTHEKTKFLRELQTDSGELTSEADLTAPNGTASLYVTPKPGDDTYLARNRGELTVSFRMEGEQVRVTGLAVKMAPIRDPKKPDPSKQTFVPVKEIAKPTEAVITDSAGTRKVNESKPAAVPHWDKATPDMQKKADETVAKVIESANPEAAGNLFNRTVGSVQTLDEKKATVPRALNAMFELYSDVMANNMKLSQLDRALRTWTGFAVNYDPADTGDATKDKAARESSVRQWFAYWYRHGNTDLKGHIEEEESLEMPGKDPKKTEPAKKK
jgi:hypothetical protein